MGIIITIMSIGHHDEESTVARFWEDWRYH